MMEKGWVKITDPNGYYKIVDRNGVVRVDATNLGKIYYYDENAYSHRIDGPAVIRQSSLGVHKEWWKHGSRHRVDGPAIEYGDGTKAWFYNGKQIDCDSQNKFEKLIKLKAFW